MRREAVIEIANLLGQRYCAPDASDTRSPFNERILEIVWGELVEPERELNQEEIGIGQMIEWRNSLDCNRSDPQYCEYTEMIVRKVSLLLRDESIRDGWHDEYLAYWNISFDDLSGGTHYDC